MLLLMSYGWTLAMRAAGTRMSGQLGFSLYYRTSILQYLPGSFWYLPGRAYFCQRQGISLSVFVGGALVELFYLLMVAGTLTGLSGLLNANLTWLIAVGLVSLAAITVVTVWPGILNWVARLLKKVTAPVLLDRRQLVRMIPVYIIVWFLWHVVIFFSYVYNRR
jgi:hypothetical protein